MAERGRAAPAAVEVRIRPAEPAAHRWHVRLTVPRPAAEQRLSIAAWIPGSYLIREFVRHVSALRARQGTRSVALVQQDKATWLAACEGSAALVVDYEVYAFDTSVRAAFLDEARGFFNPTCLVLRAHGREDAPHRLVLDGLPRGWQVATAMDAERVDARGGGAWRAGSYDELVDHPFELGIFWRRGFRAVHAGRPIPHGFVVAGAWPDFDGERLVADTRRICEAAFALWHGDGAGRPPIRSYLFLLNAVDDGHGGLEHRASTALVASRRDLPRIGEKEASDGYVGLLGLVSHEYFHLWNVKRLRPAEFARLDYAAENYTRLLWFFEGFTSYYDDLLLRRAGLVDDARYLKLLAKQVAAVAATPGRAVQSVADASFDAWVKYYRPDENTPNATVSYYAKGALVALALDLTLRREGHGTLDDVLRRLWSASGGGPIAEADIADALAAVGGRRYDDELAAWVHGTDELPLAPLLAAFGVRLEQPEATLAQRLGVRVAESALTGVKLTHVLRGSAAEAAGLAAGDELIGADGWRIRRIDDLLRLAPGDARAPLRLVVARDQRLLERPLALPGAQAHGVARPTAALTVDADAPRAAAALRARWLAG